MFLETCPFIQVGINQAYQYYFSQILLLVSNQSCTFINLQLRGVYMRKFILVRVSYLDDFLISYLIYIMTWSFQISLFEGTLHDDKIHMSFKIATLQMHYPFQSTGRPISYRNGWTFRIYMIPLQDFVPEWNSCPGTRTRVNSRRGDLCRHDILWWYHVNKYRAMRGNRSELAPRQKSLVSCKHPLTFRV